VIAELRNIYCPHWSDDVVQLNAPNDVVKANILVPVTNDDILEGENVVKALHD
jgi:hypothetical protein